MQGKVEQWILTECDQLEPEHVLEIGVGSGEIFSKLLTIFPNSKIKGIDISSGMLQRTLKKIHRIEHDNFSLEKSDIITARFEHSFDLIISNFVLDTLSNTDIQKALYQVHHNLNNDGVLLVSTIHYGRKWYDRIIPAIGKNLPFLLGFAKPIDIQRYLEESEFRIVRQEITSQNGLSAIHTKAIKL